MDLITSLRSLNPNQTNRNKALIQFPVKLHVVLDAIEADGFADIMSWQPNGQGFSIHKSEQFEMVILPKYFPGLKRKSFFRHLSLYGFQRLRQSGSNGYEYHHKFFVRHNPQLLRQIGRRKHSMNNRPLTAGDSTPTYALRRSCMEKSENGDAKGSATAESVASAPSSVSQLPIASNVVPPWPRGVLASASEQNPISPYANDNMERQTALEIGANKSTLPVFSTVPCDCAQSLTEQIRCSDVYRRPTLSSESLSAIELDNLDDLDELTALDNSDFDLLFDSLTRSMSAPDRLGDCHHDLGTNQAPAGCLNTPFERIRAFGSPPDPRKCWPYERLLPAPGKDTLKSIALVHRDVQAAKVDDTKGGMLSPCTQLREPYGLGTGSGVGGNVSEVDGYSQKSTLAINIEQNPPNGIQEQGTGGVFDDAW
jgi:HSF-type DNA-binding